MVGFQIWVQLGISLPLECTNFEMAQLFSGLFFFLFFWLLFKEWMNGGKKPSQSNVMTKLTLL